MAIIGFVKVQSSTIENKYLRVKSINIGACLYEVYDKKKKINLILNLGPTKNYSSKNFYVGATCGRYAGRISNSNLTLKIKFINSMATKEKIHYTEEKKDLIDWSGKYIVIQKIKLSINCYLKI